MKKAKLLSLSVALLFLSSIGLVNAQSACDTEPDTGQTVGKCGTLTSPGGDIASCSIDNEGPTCFFGNPVIDE